MAGFNQATIVGNVGQEPEIRTTQDGRKIANFSVATSEQWKDKQTGEKREITDWHRIVVFGPPAEIVEKYVSKGDKICVVGPIKTRKWQDQSGADRWSTEIVVQGFGSKVVLLGSGGGGSDRAEQQASAYGGGYDNSSGSNDPGPSGGDYSRDPDDEIPF